MSLSDIHNPKAAANLIERFRKRFKSKVCMAPYENHDGSIVSAHTLSVEAMLRLIAVESHVYVTAQAKRMAKDVFPLEMQKRGLRDVTVFNGFCQKHDREMFMCLETQPFRFLRKQTFMLAYRAVTRECYLKRKQYETLPTAQEYADMHGIEGEFAYADEMLLHQAATLRGAEDVERLKTTFDQHLLSSSWNRMVTRAILFPSTPTVLAAAAFQPFFDMNGQQLQPFEDPEAEMSAICMSVIPTETGGAAIFSWLDSSNSAPERFFESVIETKDFCGSVLHAIFDNTENFAINPTWYEALDEQQRQYIFSRISILEQTSSYSKQSRPEESGSNLANWGEGVVSAF